MKTDHLTCSILVSSSAALGFMKAREIRDTLLSSRHPESTLDGHTRNRRITMAHSGNDIASLEISPRGGTGVYVLCHGLGTSSNSLLLLADLIHRRTLAQVITYDRAGYRCSRVGSNLPFTIREAVDDLKDVIDHVAVKDSPITLIGHSLGGLVAYKFAARFADLVQRLVLVEPTHPKEVRVAPQKRGGVVGISEMIRLNTDLSGLGFSLLNETPDLGSRQLNNPYVFTVTRELGTGRLWRAMRREWRTLEPMLIDGATEIEIIRCPIQVFSSDSTLTAIAEQKSIFEDLLPAGESVDVIPDSDHFTIVLDKDHASNITQRINL
ncbi:alpha/beta hydrolase [Actinomyces sp. 2119]|uniref:alpha/beta hydrolase n=1 Tax=Actinomyces sp. 2119 TaxID=2321393 RepID=UPI000E6C1C8C|nr:alpha/beta hydrolase [Actinomyces sp. 2119]RJF42482.1 alpha/beta hydrolase [Actinomyces sp. 2119]